MTLDELRDAADDAADDEVQRAIDNRRRERLMAEARERQLARFGEVLPIGRDDYTREITEASKVDEAGDEKSRGTGVVALLYKDGYIFSSTSAIECRLTLRCLPVG